MTTLPEEAVKAAAQCYLDRTVSINETASSLARAMLTVALPFLPVQGAVKKLEWRKYRNGDAEAVTPFVEIYTAYVNGYWRITRNGKAGKFIKATGGDDVEAAKAAAQADYSARILSAIETGIPATEPSAARSLALEALAAIADGEGEAQVIAQQTLQSIRSLSSPDHADAGKVEGDGWLPIESAPKDGTRILAAGMKQGPTIEIVSYGSSGPYNRSTKQYAKGWSCIPGHLLEPTHWRPLPSAPASEGAE